CEVHLSWPNQGGFASRQRRGPEPVWYQSSAPRTRATSSISCGILLRTKKSLFPLSVIQASGRMKNVLTAVTLTILSHAFRRLRNGFTLINPTLLAHQ